jgi:hypothetical protein
MRTEVDITYKKGKGRNVARAWDCIFMHSSRLWLARVEEVQNRRRVVDNPVLVRVRANDAESLG